MVTPDHTAPGPGTGRTQTVIAGGAVLAVAAHLVWLWLYSPGSDAPVRPSDLPLLFALTFGGGWLVFGLLVRISRGEFGSDLLAGISIVTSVALGEYLAGTLVVLMLSGGEALEA